MSKKVGEWCGGWGGGGGGIGGGVSINRRGWCEGRGT